MFTKLITAFKAIDWTNALYAALKAAWPFMAGALGGILSGCSVLGSGVGVTL